MSRATISFKLPDENDRFKDAVNATEMKLVLYDLDQYLRGKVKYSEDGKEADVCEQVRDYLHEQLREYGITLD
jgi:hypothetical protein